MYMTLWGNTNLKTNLDAVRQVFIPNSNGLLQNRVVALTVYILRYTEVQMYYVWASVLHTFI